MLGSPYWTYWFILCCGWLCENDFTKGFILRCSITYHLHPLDGIQPSCAMYLSIKYFKSFFSLLIKLAWVSPLYCAWLCDVNLYSCLTIITASMPIIKLRRKNLVLLFSFLGYRCIVHFSLPLLCLFVVDELDQELKRWNTENVLKNNRSLGSALASVYEILPQGLWTACPPGKQLFEHFQWVHTMNDAAGNIHGAFSLQQVVAGGVRSFLHKLFR